MIHTSQRVRAEDFSQPWLNDRLVEMAHSSKDIIRKLWEWAYIAQIYHENIRHDGMALGFGVGREFTPAWLASRGAYVIATDLPEDKTGDWTGTDQHASGLDSLGWAGICTEVMFRSSVEFRPVDMTHIPEDLLQGEFDFVWSSSSLEHLGSLQTGIDFICESMKCLRPGGIAVHTTEFNYSHPTVTINSDNLCLFRKKDLHEIEECLRNQGDRLWPLDLIPGVLGADLHVSVHPYTEPHLNLMIGEFMSTSVALVAKKGAV